MAQLKARTCASPNPMVDNETIERAIIESGYSLAQFAELIGLCYHTLRTRLDDGRWTVREAWEVCNLLSLPLDTFFAFPERLKLKGAA